ncbi:MAG TPA: ABC transporter ATP-binding protein [Clostridiales bacterium]|nr:ABC transporter ATP-binding protein [Clostridiales bacterium]
MTILKVENLTKSFGGLQVLTGVTFDVKKGEKLALIGPNGAGKSTLLNAIGGQGLAKSGNIEFNGKTITYLSPNKRLKLGLGRSYQANNLFWQLSILENVLLALHGSDKSHFQMFRVLEKRKDLRAEAERLLSLVNLWEKRHEYPPILSYGEQRLLELLLAFTSKPDLVLLDEPSAGLPTAQVGEFTETLRELAKDTTLLFCAHDMDLVFNLSDNIMVLYYGTIMAKGTPQEIAANPKVREIYLGSEAVSNI